MRVQRIPNPAPTRLPVVTELLPSAVLWDMDGTLVDTEPYWMQAEIELVASFGGIWTAQDGLTLVGSGPRGVRPRCCRTAGVALSADEIVDRLTTRVLEQVETEVPWRPGALELLAELKDAGVPERRRHHVGAADGRARRIRGAGRLVRGHRRRRRGHAQQTASRAIPARAELMGAAPQDCVAIEDSLPGLESAAAAGAVCIGVPLHVALPEDATYTLWDTPARQNPARPRRGVPVRPHPAKRHPVTPRTRTAAKADRSGPATRPS